MLALAALVLAGCAAGNAGSSQSSEERREAKGEGSKERLGHPALGSAEAPVVLTEYSDYQ